MEKENSELSAAGTGKHETRGTKRRQPNALGSVAIDPETARPRQPAVEARWLHSAPPAPEKIGHMLMSAEASARSGEKSKSVNLPTELAGQRVETLNRADLMSLSEKIVIDGSNLRQIYETHLIGERGLRRLVAEYLHGGDLKQALRGEVIERERDFERDPAVRDMIPDQTVSGSNDAGSTNSAKAALDELLEKAEASSGGMSEEAAFFKARAQYEAKELHQHKQHRRTMDVGVVAIILILLILVVVLFLTRT